MAPARQAIGEAPDVRPARPASRSMTRKAKPRALPHRVRTVAKRTEVKHAKPRHRTVVRARRAPAPRSGLAAVVAFARAQVGERYVSGGEGNGWDCSGLTRAAYRRIGISLPHSSRGQGSRGRSVSKSQRRAGDLMVWPGHVAIYIGGGRMIDAGNHRVGVVSRRIWGSPQYRRL